MGVLNTFGQAHHLNAENLLTSLLHIGGFRDKGMRIHLTYQLEVAWLNAMSIDNLCRIAMLSIHIGAVGATLRAKLLHIYLRYHQLGFE